MSDNDFARMPALDALVGLRIPGGCPDCDAYQDVERVAGIYHVTVFHDDTCPTFRAHTRRTRRRRR